MACNSWSHISAILCQAKLGQSSKVGLVEQGWVPSEESVKPILVCYAMLGSFKAKLNWVS